MGDSDGQITISCFNHHEIMINRLWEFFLTEQQVDFDIQRGEKLIKAHRLILALFLLPEKLAAPVAEDPNLSDDHHKSTRIALESLVEFLYRGRVTVPKEQMGNLLEVAKESGFQMLVDAVESATEDAVDAESDWDMASAPLCSIELHTGTCSGAEPDTRLDVGSSDSQQWCMLVDKIKTETNWTYEDREESDEEETASSCVEPPPARKVATIEPGKKAFPCEWCGKIFKYLHHLHCHRLTHTGERPHKCQFCESDFVQKAHLNRHMANAHGSPKHFKCVVCPASFSTSQARFAHARFHNLPKRQPEAMKRKLDDS